FEKDLTRDIKKLEKLIVGMADFATVIEQETIRENNHKSSDSKLEELIKVINTKREEGHNSKNQKVLIFTSYTDTAKYLFDQLTARGFSKIAMVSGAGAKTDDQDDFFKNFEPILERFAPY